MSDAARKTFELLNDVQPLDQADDILLHDADEQRRILAAAPWKTDPDYFTEVRISAIALIKMVIHARSGGIYEIMGLLQGKVLGRAFVVMDTFALPVQGTETRVNAAQEADGYMIAHRDGSQLVDRPENIVGWYHSHPGYGCWLSGIDVSTQLTNQRWQDPFLALVVDPNRTVSAGKVDLGAFRTYPEGHAPAGGATHESVPVDKLEDFGAHANEYYALKVSVFKSSLDAKLLDLLWEKYWVKTLSSSSLVAGRKFTVSQLSDLTAKLSQAETGLHQSAAHARAPAPAAGGATENKAEGEAAVLREEEEGGALAKAVKDGTRISVESQHAMMAQVLKDQLFNLPRRRPTAPAPVPAPTA